MSEKKLVIKLKYGASALPEKSSASLHRQPEYEWNYNRVAFALVVGVIVLALSVYSVFSESEDRGATDHTAETDLSTQSERHLKQPLLNSPAVDRHSALMRPDENPPLEVPQSTNRAIDSPAREGFQRENPPVMAEIHANGVDPDTGVTEGITSPDEAKVDVSAPAESKPILRAHFAWGIQNKGSTGAISSPAILQSGDSVTIYFFSEFDRLQGQKVSHEWSHNGQVKHIRAFEIRAPWRVFSSMQLNSERLGKWKVAIRDSNGKTLGEYALNVLNPAKPE